jgi:NAD-dependent SIR2 family protein deacetylase
MNIVEMAEFRTCNLRPVENLVNLVRDMPRQDPRFALLLGAGASWSSGIPTAENLVAQWRRQIFLSQTGKDRWWPHYTLELEAWQQAYRECLRNWEAVYGRQPSEYSLLFSHFCPDVDARQGFIENICSGCEPGPGYIYLASLESAGYFKTFLTTNFDDLIHDALYRYGGAKPIVCAFDSQVASVRPVGPRPKVLKLHGDFLYNNIRAVSAEVGRLDSNMQDKFEATCKNYGLIVIGYGGQDQSVMAPIRTMLHRLDYLKHGIHWCIFSPSRKKSDKRDPPPEEFGGSEKKEANISIPRELYQLWESYTDKFHLYKVDSFDHVMEALYQGCRCSPPEDLAKPQEKALYARLRDGIENADQTWRLTYGFSQLLASFRAATSDPPREGVILLDEADQCHREGLILLDKGKLDEAERLFQKSREKSTQALSMPEEKALTPSQKVRALRRRCGSTSSLADVLVRRQGKGARPPGGEALGKAALEDVQRALRIDQDLGRSADLKGHRINLWFNGLAAHAQILYFSGYLGEAASRESLGWLDHLMNDDTHADEHVASLTEELGGELLLAELQKFDEDAKQERSSIGRSSLLPEKPEEPEEVPTQQ